MHSADPDYDFTELSHTMLSAFVLVFYIFVCVFDYLSSSYEWASRMSIAIESSTPTYSDVLRSIAYIWQT